MSLHARGLSRLFLLVVLIAHCGCVNSDHRWRQGPRANPPPAPQPTELPPAAPPPAAPPPAVPQTAVPEIPPTQPPPVLSTQTIAPPPPPAIAAAPPAAAPPASSQPATPTALPIPIPTADPTAPTAAKPDRVHELYAQAVTAYAPIDSYAARLRRREQVNGQDRAEEIIAFQFRKQPWSVHFKWLGKEGQGREVIYVKDRYEDKIHTLLGEHDTGRMFFAKVSLAVDDPRVKANSRHSITEAGFGSLIASYGRALAREDAPGAVHALKYLGMVQRPEHPDVLEGVEQTVAAHVDPLMPGGGRRLWFFQPANHMPVLIVTQDASGHEVEYYSYDRIQMNPHLDDDDFNPDKLGALRR